MSNIIDIYNSKFAQEKLVDNNNFYNNLEEIQQQNLSQKRTISSVNYNYMPNFIKFGSAEEYYQNGISHIESNYPYDGSTVQKLKWVNNLSDFEYHIFSNEYPKSVGHASISGTQHIKIYSHIKDPDTDSKTAYEVSRAYSTNSTLNFETGITLQAWLNFEDSTQNTNILSVTSLTSSFVQSEILKIYRTSGSLNYFEITDGINVYNFQTTINNNEWHHYTFCISNDKASLFVDGQLKEQLENVSFQPSILNNIFTPVGLLEKDFFLTNPDVSSFEKIPVFKVGGLGKLNIDDLRLYNNIKSIEKIGRYWQTQVDGNDFSDPDNSDLLFYYKFNEGWDPQYQFLCLDYSGCKNDGEIVNYEAICRKNTSAIDLSNLCRTLEKPDLIYKGISYSTIVMQYYDTRISSAKEYDESNIHLLYNKLPSWVLEQEESLDSKYLKQLIQVMCYYFDDLYVKIEEIVNYKTAKYSDNKDKIYPFYNKILSSTGFDFTELFTNLDIVEKISSRNDKDIFDGNIEKIKNFIFQNIYNNLAYILKSKGTEKSIKSLLHSYGVNNELVKINLYADNAEYNIADRSKETVVKKKTVSLSGENIIYLSASSVPEDSNLYQYTLEVCTSFPAIFSTSNITSSIFGIINNSSSFDTSTSNNSYEYSVLIENDGNNRSRFVFTDNTNMLFSNYYENLYDDSAWNLAIRKKLNIDTIYGTSSLPSVSYELYGINTNSTPIKEFSCSLPPAAHTDGYIRHYIGAKKQDLSGSILYNAGSKFLYCNFWTDYLNNDIVTSHNKDILNYGVDE